MATQHAADVAPAWLLRVEGRTVRLPAAGASTVGRAAGCTITLSDPRVSARHASLTVEHDRVIVEDPGSTNGTRVNGERVAGRRVLRSGDLISFGGVPAGRLVRDAPTARAATE